MNRKEKKQVKLNDRSKEIMINKDNNSIELTANSIEAISKSKEGTTSLKLEQLENGNIKITQNIENKCEHIIGMLNDYDNTYNITLKQLKHYIKQEQEQYEYEIKNYPDVARKPFNLSDYMDRRKSTNLTRYNFCPICGRKIDWKNIKENDK